MERTEQSYPISATGRVRIQVGASEIFVRGGSEPTVHLTLIKRRSDDRTPRVEPGTDSLSISFESSFGWHGQDADLELVLPSGLTLEIASGSGDLHLEGWQGRLEHRSGSGDVDIRKCGGEAALRSASGDLEIREYQGPIGAATTSGDVRLEAVQGWVRLQTISGDVEVERTSGNLEVQTVSGDLSVESWYGAMRLATVSGDLSGGLFQCPRISVSTVSGDLQLSLEPVTGGEYEIKSTSGDINLRIPRSARLAIRVATLSGDVSNDLPLSREDAREETLDPTVNVGIPWLEKDWVRIGRKFSGVLNARDGSLTVKTISGDISLRGIG
ncbi:MAG: DUF4097 family beta strand repeat-containing protein [Coprothermobacterota bacterium]|nr:DUF4097 family beta strand repeat-containing protein [Coprothermobacterota bacterium]